MKCNNEILNAFSTLGLCSILPNLETLDSIERFVVQMYGKSKVPAHIKNLPELRWYMFSKYQSDASALPPTMSALKYKVFRCHYLAMVLKSSHKPLQQLPLPENYGWEWEKNLLVPIMTDNLPAPIAMIELSMCSCKTNCNTMRCKCRKNYLLCTDMCKCIHCENDELENGSSSEESECEEEDVEFN